MQFITVETERENLLDGDYVAVIRNIEEKMDKYGSYLQLEEELLSPVDVEGRREFERFYTGAYDDDKKRKAIWAFSKLAKQLLDLKANKILNTDDLIGKHYIKTVKNNIAANGTAYQNTTNRLLIEDVTFYPQKEEKAVMYGTLAVPSQEASKQVWPIDDEVPF